MALYLAVPRLIYMKDFNSELHYSSYSFPSYSIMSAPTSVVGEPSSYSYNEAPTGRQTHANQHSDYYLAPQTNFPSLSDHAQNHPTGSVAMDPASWDSSSFYSGAPSPEGYAADVSSTAPSSPGSLYSADDSSVGPAGLADFAAYPNLALGAGSEATDLSDGADFTGQGAASGGSGWDSSLQGTSARRPRTMRYTEGINRRRERSNREAVFVCQHVNCVPSAGRRGQTVDFTSQKALNGTSAVFLDTAWLVLISCIRTHTSHP